MNNEVSIESGCWRAVAYSEAPDSYHYSAAPTATPKIPSLLRSLKRLEFVRHTQELSGLCSRWQMISPRKSVITESMQIAVVVTFNQSEDGWYVIECHRYQAACLKGERWMRRERTSKKRSSFPLVLVNPLMVGGIKSLGSDSAVTACQARVRRREIRENGQ
jgi:hypothetical protein